MTWSRYRRGAQLLAALALLSPLAGLTFYLGTYSASLLFGWLHLADPFTALQVGVLPLAVAALPVVALNLLLGRVFCGWICPLGFLLEGVDWLRRRLRLKERRLPRWARWPLAAGVLAGSIAAGMPLFEWLSPQANLYRMLLFGLAGEGIILPAVMLADLLLARRLWCSTLCPAGVTYGLLARIGGMRVGLDPDRCDKCGACLSACPQGRFVLHGAVSGRDARLVADPAACIACGKCMEVCHADALSFRFDPRPDPGRRRALVTLGVAGLVMALGQTARAMVERPRKALRPPGAQPEGLFTALCIRCGKCAQVCDMEAIRMDAGGLPYIDPRSAPCDLCRKCPEVCPTGALTLGPNEPIRMGTAEIHRDGCLAWQGTLCRACFVACPLQGKALKLEGSGAVWRPVIDPDHCTGCGLCVYACPTATITITPSP